MTSDLDLETSPQNFFRECLLEALSKLRLSVDVWTEYYLVDLLSRRALQVPIMEPLVLQLKIAQEAEHVKDRFESYRLVGDTALMLLGFFGDHVDRKALSRSYVSYMGSGAYRETATLSESVDGLRQAYEALSYGFDEFSRVLNEVRELTALQTPDDVLLMVRAVNETKSPSVTERLGKKGLFLGRKSEGDN